MTKEKYNTAMVRAVKVLSADLRQKAKKMKLKDNDIVLVKVGQYHSEPEYELVKINGSIIEFLKKNGIEVER
jgi:putative NADH-flavin reductase